MVASFELRDGDEDESTRDSEGLLDVKERRYIPHPRSCLKMNHFYWALFTFSILANIFLVWHSILLKLSFPAFQIASDVHGVSPIIPTKEVTFYPNRTFIRSWRAGNKNEDTRDAWLSIMPRGMGWLALRNKHYPRLPPPVILNETAFYSTSMIHQLHCLHMMMTTFNTLSRDEPHPKNSPVTYEHIDHCFDYIRQSIMCCGDTALEGVSNLSNDPIMRNETDGWGFTHVCKDYGEVIGFMEGWRDNDWKAI